MHKYHAMGLQKTILFKKLPRNPHKLLVCGALLPDPGMSEIASIFF
jgi:hypothetical protein